MSVFCMLIHCCLSVCFYYSLLITTALYYVLKYRSVLPVTFHFLYQIILDIHCFVIFHIYFRRNFSILPKFSLGL